VSHVIFIVNSDFPLKSVNQLALVIEMQCIFCEADTEFLNNIQINFMLQSVKKEVPSQKSRNRESN
jgi:hypothetical protein